MSKTLDPSIQGPLSSSTPSSTSHTSANRAFWLMWSLNFINYADRYTFTAVSTLVAAEFHLDYSTLGFIAGSIFLLTYTLGILPMGLLADRIKRKYVIAGGVGFWSLITFFTGLAPNVGTLIATRGALGLGEASYYPPSTSLLSSYYPSNERSKVMSRWGMGSMVGLAFGFILGGIIGQLYGWRIAFFIFGIPGIILALITLRMKEPPRNAVDDADVPELVLARAGFKGIRKDLRELWNVASLRVVIAVQAMGFFVLFATVTFLPTFLHEQFGISAGAIGTISGAVIVIGGVAGLFIGSILADRLAKRMRGARIFVGGLGFFLTAPFFAASILSAIATNGMSLNVRLYGIFLPIFLVTVTLINIYTGPMGAVTQDVVAPARRAASIGLTLTLSHLLGDLISPWLVGWIGDTLKANASLAWLHGLGVTPHNALGVALLITCVPLLLIAGIVGMTGSRYVQKDQDNLATQSVVPSIA